MTTTLAHAKPEVMRWARESIGYSQSEAADLIGVRLWKLAAVEEGVEYLTIREAERAADAYERPVAALFLPAPPDEEPPEAQFRRLPGSPPLPWPPAMRLLARRIRERQDAATELYDVLDEQPPWHEQRSKLRISEDLSEAATRARTALGVTFEQQKSWLDPRGYRPLRAWVDAVEALGILVMQDGSMEVEDMRGFASVHDDAPAIVMNIKDDPRARVFTLVHELGHLLLMASGRETGPETEGWCNDFAGEVLMPRREFAVEFKHNYASDPLERVHRLALRFGVTPMAAAVRVARYELVAPMEAEELVAAVHSRWDPAEDVLERTGGNYYWNEIGRLGPGFIRLVFTALESQAVTYPAASGLLGVKVSNFDNLREYLGRRR